MSTVRWYNNLKVYSASIVRMEAHTVDESSELDDVQKRSYCSE